MNFSIGPYPFFGVALPKNEGRDDDNQQESVWDPYSEVSELEVALVFEPNCIDNFVWKNLPN